MPIYGPIPNSSYKHIECLEFTNALEKSHSDNVIIYSDSKDVDKTEFITSYIKEKKIYDNYHIFWINFNTDKEFTDSLIKIEQDSRDKNEISSIFTGILKNPVEKQKQEFFKKIRDYSYTNDKINFFIILNGVNEREHIEDFPSLFNSKFILITELLKNKLSTFNNIPNLIEIKLLDEEKANKYAREQLSEEQKSDIDFKKNIQIILIKCNMIPKSFVRAIDYIKYNNMFLHNFVKLIERQNVINFDEILIETIKQENSNLSKLSIQFIQVCSYVNTEHLSYKFLNTLFEKLFSLQILPNNNAQNAPMQSNFDNVITFLSKNGLLDGNITSGFKVDNKIKNILIKQQVDDKDIASVKVALDSINSCFLLRRNDISKDIRLTNETFLHAKTLHENIKKFMKEAELVANINLLVKFIELTNSLGLFYGKKYYQYKLAITEYYAYAKSLTEKVASDLINKLLSEEQNSRNGARNELTANNDKKMLIEIYSKEILQNYGNISIDFYELTVSNDNEEKKSNFLDSIHLLEKSFYLQKYMSANESIDGNFDAIFTLRTLARNYREKAIKHINDKEKAEVTECLDRANELLSEAKISLVKSIKMKKEIPANLSLLLDVDEIAIMKLEQDKMESKGNYTQVIDLYKAKIKEIDSLKNNTYLNKIDVYKKDKANILLWLAESYSAQASIDTKKSQDHLKNSESCLLTVYSLTEFDKFLLPEFKEGTLSEQDKDKLSLSITLYNFARLFYNMAKNLKFEKHFGFAYYNAEIALKALSVISNNENSFHYINTKRLYDDLQEQMHSINELPLNNESLDNKFNDDLIYKTLFNKVRYNPIRDNFINMAKYLYDKKYFRVANYYYNQGIQHNYKKIDDKDILQYSDTLARVGEYDKAMEKLITIPFNKIFNTDLFSIYKETYNRCIVGLKSMKRENENNKNNFTDINEYTDNLIENQKIFFYEFLKQFQLVIRNFTLPNKKEKKLERQIAYFQLLNLDLSFQFGGTGGSVKIPLGNALRENYKNKLERLRKEKNLEKGDIDKLHEFLYKILKELAKRLANIFNNQLSRLTQNGNIKILAKHLATKIVNYVASGEILDDKLLTEKDNSNIDPKKSLVYVQLLSSVFKLNEESDNVKFKNETGEAKKWTVYGIIQHSGIKIDGENEYYIRKDIHSANHKKYKFRFMPSVVKEHTEFFDIEKDYEFKESEAEANQVEKKHCIVM